ncbi:MAG: hypothetical protein JW889_16365 [Verrucomicrobia bacterium]|nr:hypothetical protein [Verrucomicrobiota bacterium]
MHRTLRFCLALGSVLLVIAAAGTAQDNGATSEHAASTTQATSEGTLPDAPQLHRWINEGGPYGGQIRDLALCVSSPNVVYAATSNGVFRSTDGAASWSPAAPVRSDGRRSPVDAVAVDSTDPDIVYAVHLSSPGDVLKSTDGGASWKVLDPGSEGWGGAPYDVGLDSKHPNTVYVLVIQRGVLKSTDGGGTWELKNKGMGDTPADYYDVDPCFPHVLYCRTASCTSMFAFENKGLTWRRFGSHEIELVSFARDPDDLQKVSVVLGRDAQRIRFASQDDGETWETDDEAADGFRLELSATGDGEHVLSVERCLQYISTDGADTWRAIDMPLGAPRVRRVRAAGEQGDTLYAATKEGVYYYSADGGETWELFYSAESDPRAEQKAAIAELRKYFLHGLRCPDDRWTSATSWHEWGHRFAVAHPSDPDTVYLRTLFEGVLKTKDFGRTWTPADHGISASVMLAMACTTTQPASLYALDWESLQKSTDGGKTWKKTGLDVLSTGDATLAVHPGDPQIVLAGRPVSLSTDGGETWNEAKELPSATIEAFVFDPKDPDTFYALTGEGIFKTTDRGCIWKPTNRPYQTSDHGSNNRYRGTYQTNATIIYQLTENEKLSRSTDLGKSWEGITSLEPKSAVRFVQVHPLDPRTVVVAGDKGELYMSNDAGETWRTAEVFEQGPDKHWWGSCIGMDPANPDVFYVGAHGGPEGILRTQDGGKTFERLSDGLPSVTIRRIVVSPADGSVYAATEGAGVYRLETDTPSPNDDPRE